MRRAPIAEFLLSRFTTREHAAAMVGDLIEIAPQPVLFRLAVSHTIARFAARPVAGVLAAAASAWALRGVYVYPVKRPLPPSETATFFFFAGCLLAMITAYSAARRSPIDPVTKIAAALWALASAAVLLRFNKPPFLICGVGFVLLLIGSLLRTRSRQAALRILAAAACAIAASYAAWQLLEPVARPVVPPHHWPVWFIAIQFLAPAVAVGAALSWRRPASPAAAVE